MKIKFIGVPKEDHASIHMYGYDFPLGKFVDVTEPEYQRKLSKHPHFEVKAADVPQDAKMAPVKADGLPADDAFVAVGASRISDGKPQTEETLAAAIEAWKKAHPEAKAPAAKK